MERLDPAHLLKTVVEHNISMCGVLPAVIVMETLRRLGGLQTVERVAYATSAEVSGDPSRVVGYAGVLPGAGGLTCVRRNANSVFPARRFSTLSCFVRMTSLS